MKTIDNIINKITMYRLVLYYLTFLFLSALGLSFAGILSYNPIFLIIGTIFILAVCVITNEIFAWGFEAPVNIESVYITAFILVLLINPMRSMSDSVFFASAFWASAVAIASKFILAANKKHIFNPAALGLSAILLFDLSATWWVGTGAMFPFVILGGLIVVRKIARFDLVWAFLITALALIFLPHMSGIADIINTSVKVFLDTPIIFFAFVMLTEPLTTPPTRFWRIFYGIIVGILYSPQFHIGSFYLAPELALVFGNVFSYSVSPKKKLILKLKEKIKLTPDTYDFAFYNDGGMKFKPGQYLEWTLAHDKSDSRGNRRYFTIASSPTEKEIHLGVKFYNDSSSFKKKLLGMAPGEKIVASQLDGEFVLPEDKNKKLAFIAGGIGITPFRGMIKYLMDTNQKRDIILAYSNRKFDGMAYKNIFDEAYMKIGLKTIYLITDESYVPQNGYYLGRIDEKFIREQIPDFKKRYFYVSGTQSMVRDTKNMLYGMGMRKSQVMTDFFPGFV